MSVISALAASVVVAGCGSGQSLSASSTCHKWISASSSEQTTFADKWLSDNSSATAAASEVVQALNNSCLANSTADTTLAKRLSASKILH